MATNTATSFTNHTAPSSGSTAGPYAISFNYLEQSDVDVTVDGVLQTLSVAYTFTSGTQITFTSGNEPANGAAIVIKRDTNISAKKVDFQDGSVLTETDLDTNTEQLLFGLQEFTDKINGIEDLSTRDMDALEIKIAYESNSNTNAFTDAEQTKLSGIEASATADQTAAEIRTLVESATDSNVFTDADHTKLNGIETGATADQTKSDIDALGIAATTAATLATARNIGGVSFDGSANIDLPGVNTAGNQNTTGSAATLTTARNIAGVSFDGSADISLNNNAITNGAGYIADLVSDTSPQLGGNLDVQSSEITTSTSNGNIKATPNGTGVFEVKSSGSVDGTLQLNCTVNSHGIKLRSPAHSAGQSYTFIFPDNNITADKYLKVKSITGSGATAVGQLEYASLDANDLGEGTIPDARFPATLPAASAANLTSIPAANITGTLPAISGANLTNIPPSLAGSSGENLFVEAENQMDNNFTTTANFNYVGASPMTIASGVTLTVSANSTMTFV